MLDITINMNLTFDPTTQTFFFLCSFYDKEVPKSVGFWWNPGIKRWYTKNPEIAKTLIKYADQNCLNQLTSITDKIKEEIKSSHAISVPDEIEVEYPTPQGLSYLPFQKAGIKYLIEHQNALLADQMGLGKTVEVIGAINTLIESNSDIKNILIVCPASLKLNWQRELQKWLTEPLEIGVVSPKHWPHLCDILIINYDILKKFQNYINSRKWDILILDECHYCKNGKARRTKLSLSIQSNIRWFLTGTPIVNYPIEIYHLVHTLRPDIFPNFRKFAFQYCITDSFGRICPKSGKNLDQLQGILRGNLMIRRLKKDVLTELPPKRRQIIELPANGTKDLIEQEKSSYQKLKELRELLRTAKMAARDANDTGSYQEVSQQLKLSIDDVFGSLSTARKELAIKKVPYVISHIEDVLENNEKIVCFAYHRDVIAMIHAHFKSNSVILTGDSTMTERDNAVTEFQNNPNITLFIGNIIAAGVGITLTASSHVVFAELDWVPGNVIQAEDRCHRIGQTDSVLIQHLILEGSLDAQIAQTLITKQVLIDKTLDKKGDPQHETI